VTLGTLVVLGVVLIEIAVLVYAAWHARRGQGE
jgi:hypothetical protein